MSLTRIDTMDLQESSLIPPIVKDYLNGKLTEEFSGTTSYHIENVLTKIPGRNFSELNRKVLVDHLHKQYASAGINLENTNKVKIQIESLLKPSTFTITTGHQLALFGGPLFMTYKILTAIKLAAELKLKSSSENFVPILWLASEDHDFEEIKSTWLFGKVVNWDRDNKNQPTGMAGLERFEELVTALEEIAGKGEKVNSWMQMIREAYSGKFTLAQASLRFYHALFGDLGLVIIEPNAPELKSLFTTTMHSDLFDQQPYRAQAESDRDLASTYKLQIHAREFNFFYLDKDLGRLSIRKDQETYRIGDSGKVFTATELREEIKSFPEHFSPNVNLRPVYQETILPNLAYVGGPAEVAYWLQLKSVFESQKVPFPFVVLRNMFLISGSGLMENLNKLNLNWKHLLMEERELIQVLTNNIGPHSISQKTDELLENLQQLVELVRDVEPALGKEILNEKLKLKEFFKHQQSAIRKAQEQKESGTINKVLKLRSKVFPDGVFQERIETLLQQELVSQRSLVTEFLAQCDALPQQLNLLQLSK